MGVGRYKWSLRHIRTCLNDQQDAASFICASAGIADKKNNDDRHIVSLAASSGEFHEICRLSEGLNTFALCLAVIKPQRLIPSWGSRQLNHCRLGDNPRFRVSIRIDTGSIQCINP